MVTERDDVLALECLGFELLVASIYEGVKFPPRP